MTSRTSSKINASADLHLSHGENSKQEPDAVRFHQARQRLSSSTSRAQALTQSLQSSAETQDQAKQQNRRPATASVDSFKANGNSLSLAHADCAQGSESSQDADTNAHFSGNGAQDSRHSSQGGASSPDNNTGPGYKRVLVHIGEKTHGHKGSDAVRELVYHDAIVGTKSKGPDFQNLERAWFSQADSTSSATFSGRNGASQRSEQSYQPSFNSFSGLKHSIKATYIRSLPTSDNCKVRLDSIEACCKAI